MVNLFLNLVIWFIAILIAIQCLSCYCNKLRSMNSPTTASTLPAARQQSNPGSSTPSTSAQQGRAAAPATRPQGTGTGTVSTTNTTQVPIDPPGLRSKVLRAIFPEQKVDTNATLVYDPESNAYQWTYDKAGNASCSICLENYEHGDLIVVSHCSHTYHRDCILGWLELKEECPNCRQRMWDADTYTLLEEEIRRIESQSVSRR